MERQIISASRRTDIPAFYADWFAARLRAGFVLVRNPFNAHSYRRVSLAPADVAAIVLWTRNPAPLLAHLPLLDSLGLAYYVHITITGLGRPVERAVPDLATAIDSFRQLSQKLGPERVIWRFDPILLGAGPLELAAHQRRFAHIAQALHGHTTRVVISFADFYRKTRRNLAALAELAPRDILAEPAALAELAGFMARVAAEHGMRLQSCAEAVDLSAWGIGHGKCIDDSLLHALFGGNGPMARDRGQRGACGCVKSIDIGAYDTCLHGCAYCYATTNAMAAARNRRAHDPAAPVLVGPCPPSEPTGP